MIAYKSCRFIFFIDFRMLEQQNYVNNFLKSEEFNRLFRRSNKASLQYIDTENIKNYLNLFDGKVVDENFINTEIKDNYLDGNYNLLLELYEYAIKYGFINETNIIFALFATIKLRDKRAKEKVLKEAKKKKIKLNLFLIFMLKIQIYFQKMKKFYHIKNEMNKIQRQFFLEMVLNKNLVQILKQKEQDKNIAFFQEKIKTALHEKRFKDALYTYDSAYFSNYLNFDISNYGKKAAKKVDNINIRDDIKNSLNRINYKIIFNEDKQLINKAIMVSAGLNNYNIVTKYKNHLDKVIQKNNIKIQKTIDNAIISLKTRRIQGNYR